MSRGPACPRCGAEMFFVPGQRANLGWLCGCPKEPRVVFCDIDGVLNHPGVYAECAGRPGKTRPVDWLDRACVARLNALCSRTGATLVLSSGWRRYLGLAGTVESLRDAGLTARVRDATPIVDVLPHDHPDAARLHRWREISLWLGAHPSASRWVVVDDLALDGVPAERFVRVDADAGITDADVDRAAAVLGAAP